MAERERFGNAQLGQHSPSFRQQSIFVPARGEQLRPLRPLLWQLQSRSARQPWPPRPSS
ncbi:hypothetical protein Mapa_018538 [Marchantia paleacea]|nr:hypothetical protein Mapa_018538 [Marchantia paleacea]